MNTIAIMSSLLAELGKLILRSEEPSGTLAEAVLKFMALHPSSFSEVETLTQKCQTPQPLEELYGILYDDAQGATEPCYLPFTLTPAQGKKAHNGFLVHIFKGEQDIAPLEAPEISIGPKQYHRVVHAFKHDLKRLESAPSIATWLSLLERYGKWIPATSRLSHISLYSYTKLKMALAACLEEKQIEESLTALRAENDSHPSPLALFAGEMVGKEKFFASLDPGMDLNALKGAVYYAQSLRENIVGSFLESLDLPICNCILQERNRFLLLVRAKDAEQLQSTTVRIEEFLWREQEGKIRLATGFLPLEWSDIQEKNFTTTLERMWQMLEERGKQPFHSLFASSPQTASVFFAPWEENPENQIHFQKRLQTLGKELSVARWVAKEKSRESLAPFCQTKEIFFTQKPENENLALYRFCNTDFACPEGKGFIFSDAIPYLGIEERLSPKACWSFIQFKIDALTHEKEKLSLGAYTTLREHLHDFFKTYLMALLREKKYRKYTYLVYLEPDFVSIVCSPYVALLLLHQVYQKFRQFTEDRYTLSGRISVFNTEYPIQQALYQEYENFQAQDTTRGKITLSGDSVPWSFLETLLSSQEKLASLVPIKGKRFLFTLWSLAQDYRKHQKNKRDTMLWRNLLPYYFQKAGVAEALEKHFLEGEKGPLYLSLALEWHYFMSLEE